MDRVLTRRVKEKPIREKQLALPSRSSGHLIPSSNAAKIPSYFQKLNLLTIGSSRDDVKPLWTAILIATVLVDREQIVLRQVVDLKHQRSWLTEHDRRFF